MLNSQLFRRNCLEKSKNMIKCKFKIDEQLRMTEISEIYYSSSTLFEYSWHLNILSENYNKRW